LAYINNNFSQAKKNEITQKSSQPRIFSVIVGVADYEGTSNDLTYSDDDARIFYDHLKKALPNEMSNGKSVLLLNKEATHYNIKKALQHIFSLSTENDFIIFYFSGHGGRNFFCPSDANINMLTHSDVKKYFKSAKAKYRLCIADACFSGSIANNGQPNSNPVTTPSLNDSRIAVIMSSKPNQTSIEATRLGQGLFSFYFIKGLRGAADLNKDTYITMDELFVYTKKNVSEKSNGKQVPVIHGKNLNRMPLSRIKR
jgi:uncharacterized caspase-like protein